MRRLEEKLRLRQWTFLSTEARSDLALHLGACFTINLSKAFHAIIGAVGAGPEQDLRILHQAVDLFPAFGETVKLIQESWIKAQAMMLARLHKDIAVDLALFDVSLPVLEITRLVPGLSDPHDGHGTATLIEVSNRRRFVYKPRPAHGEQIWFAILGWLNREGFQPQFRVPAVIQRSRYHWMEFLPTMACANKSAVQRFYFRWGAQTALCDAIGLVDLHHENWIAAGEQPILVDVETFGRTAWRPRRKGAERAPPLPSLLRTGLFPFGADRNLGDYAAIAPFDTSAAVREPLAWPRCDGITHGPARYGEEIATGYEMLTRFVWRDAARRLKLSRMVHRAAGRRGNRVFVRSSAEYRRLLLASLQPYEILGGTTRLSFLLRACAQTAPSPSIAMAEARELLRCSIPRFTAVALRVTDSSIRLPSIAEMRRSNRLLRTHFARTSGE